MMHPHPRFLAAAALAGLAACSGIKEPGAPPPDEGPGPVLSARYDALSSNGGIASVTASSYQPSNPPANAIDGDLSTRWAAYGVGSWIALDLGAVRSVSGVQIAWYRGALRQYFFTVAASSDGINYTDVYSGTSSGTTFQFELYSFPSTSARYLRVTVNGNTKTNWASITEIAATTDAITTAPPPSTAITVSVAPQTASVVAGGTVQFTATVTGSTDPSVTWSVLEGTAGGTVTSTGLYTAPATSGTYHVIAQSNADPTQTGRSAVTVTAATTTTTGGTPPPPVTSTSFPTWLVDGSTRVGRTNPAGAQTSITVYAAGNEYEPFQVVMQAPAGGLTNVSATVSDFAGPSTIPSSNFPLFLEKYLKANYGSSNSGITNWNGNPPLGPGLYADGLVPFKVNGQNNPSATPFTVPAGTNQPLWVDLYVPPNTPRGTYTGSVTITSDQGNSTVAVTLKVWGFNHPLVPAEKSFMGLNGSNFTAEYKSFLLQHKLAPRALTPSDVSTFQSSYGIPDVDLSYNTGYSNFECTYAGETPPSVSSIQQRMAQFPSGSTLIDYMADELTSTSYDSTLVAYAYNFHQAGALTSCDFQPRSGLMNDGTGRSACDIWVMLSREINPSDSSYQLAQSRGNQFWWYTAEVQDSYAPKWLVDFTPLNFRMHGFINQAMNFHGVLYWTLDHWSSDPWAYADDFYDSSVSGYCEGEGTLLYPPSSSSFNAGTGTAPAASMRLKWVRKGVEDYELVNLLKQHGLASTASTQLGAIATSDRNWSKDPVAVENARANMGNALDAALNP